MWFAKKVTVFQKKDRDTWQKVRDALKGAGLEGVKAGHYEAESLRACGCGSKLDPRNFGAGGKIDREVYFVDVRQEDEELAKSILVSCGIEAVIDEPVGRLGRV